MFKRILAATDFSTSADAAWQFAVDVVAQHGGELLLLHVTMPMPPGASHPMKQTHERHVAAAQRLLGELVARATERGLTARPLVRSGDPIRTLVQTAHEEAVDLVVVGAHPYRDVERTLVGSVAERLVRAAPCAVLVIKPGEGRRKIA